MCQLILVLHCTAQVTSSTNSFISPIAVDILLLKPIAVRPGDVDENQYFIFTMRNEDVHLHDEDVPLHDEDVHLHEADVHLNILADQLISIL